MTHPSDILRKMIREQFIEAVLDMLKDVPDGYTIGKLKTQLEQIREELWEEEQ